MAIVTPSAFHGLASNTYTADRLRRLVETLAGDVEGVVGVGDLLVSPTAPTGMSVSVAAGRAFVRGDDVVPAGVRQGLYLAENLEAAVVGVTDADGALPRIDLVILEERDAAADGGSAALDVTRFRVVEGTPAASPSAPALPDSAIPLAELAVAAGASTIEAGDITDVRPHWTAGAGNVLAARLTCDPADADQVISAGSAKLAMTVLDYGSAAVADAPNSRLYLPRPGLWQVKASAKVVSATGGGALHILSSGTNPSSVRPTGSGAVSVDLYDVPSDAASLRVRLEAQVEVVDPDAYVELWGIWGGTQGTIDGQDRHLEARYLGALAA